VSTISKIGGPKVRESRAMRRKLLHDTRRVRDSTGYNVAERVERWAKDSKLTGAEKNERCTQLARELTGRTGR
jgi:hypothetical protein